MPLINSLQIARALVRFNHVARFIVNANHSFIVAPGSLTLYKWA
jgi:hypothetical protein